MRSVRSEVEWFRPLVGAQQWDYVVLWKLGNDPSRFIEWMGCCCSGSGSGDKSIVKEEKSNDDKLLVCRDISLNHSVRTKACESLSNFPSSMDLYSGIHSEVVISRQPRWLDQDGGVGTRAFVPVKGGLIEFFSTKNIPKDKKVMDLILSHCKTVSLEQEATTSPSSQALLGNSAEGSPSISNQLVVPIDSNSNYAEQKSRCARTPAAAAAGSKRAVIARRKEKGEYQSKNLLAERERRRRIKNGLLTLRSLVPKITKMDMASILGDAVKYIRGLQIEEMELRGELNEIDEQQVDRRERSKHGLVIIPDPEKSTSDSSTFGTKKQTEIKVEVNKIGDKKFFVKLIVARKRGEFLRLLEIMDSLNLQVVSTNSTAFDGGVQSILEVKADKDIEPKTLKGLFTELTS